MDGNRVNYVAEVESTTGQGAGLLELWDGAGQVVWHHAGVCCLSVASGEFGAEEARNASGNGAMVPKTKKGRSAANWT